MNLNIEELIEDILIIFKKSHPSLSLIGWEPTEEEYERVRIECIKSLYQLSTKKIYIINLPNFVCTNSQSFDLNITIRNIDGSIEVE